jgi:hypothetical protein
VESHGGTLDQLERRLRLNCATCSAELLAILVAVETLITFTGRRP